MANTKTYYDTLASVASAADSDIIVVQTTGTSDLSTMKKTTVGALRQKTVDMIASNAHAASNAGSYVFGIEQDSTGRVDANLKGFETLISEASASPDNAPTASAVRAYVHEVRTVEVASDIASAVNALDVAAAGGEGKYIKQVSEENGKIIPVEETLETNVANSTNKAPTTSAVKTYVDNKINSLDVNTIGDRYSLLQTISEADGKISATTISLEQDLSDAASAVPSSKAVKDEINSLNASFGNSSTLLKSIDETAGVITATTIPITGSIVNDADAIPTSRAVYNKVNEALTTALEVLDYSSGAAGYYFDTIKQNDGQILTTSKKFDTYEGASGATAGTWRNNGEDITPDNNNVPTSSAVKAYVDWQASRADKRMNETELPETGSDGSYIQKVKQSSGAVTVTTKAFRNTKLASYVESTSASAGSYAADTTTAPTVRAVTEQIKRLDGRIDDANAGLTNLSTGPFGASGAFISKVQQTSGYINASLTSFVDTIPDTTTSADNVAPTVNAIRKAINKLDVDQIGAEGKYIRYVVETDGKISATPVTFDLFGTSSAASAWASSTDDNAPSTKAVYNFVNRVKTDILSSTEAMTYEGTVGNFNDISTKAEYDKGDTYIASGNFNLESSSGAQIKYNVNAGDMLIWKSDKTTTYNKDSFDIVGGSEYQVISNGSPSVVDNIAVFANTRGIVIKDSGESINTIKTRQTDAACSASKAACSASYAASSAVVATNRVAIVEAQARQSSVAAASAASGAQESSKAAVNAKTGAQNAEGGACSASKAAVNAKTGAQDSSKAAASAASGAQESSKAAASAASGAQESSKAAVNAKTGAQDASKAAVNAKTGAQAAEGGACSASIAAVAAKTGAQDASNLAVNAKTGAQNASNLAVNAKTGAQAAETAAVNAKTGAQAAETSAKACAVSAACSASAASSYASAANLEGIKNAASKSAASAASSATLASNTVADCVKKSVTSAQTMAGPLNLPSLTATTIVASTFTANSSRKLKENIQPTIISALNLIDSVDVVDFNYINDNEKTPHVGFIAEDTDRLLSTPHQNMMDYTNCIGVLLKAVQEITKGMEKLEKRLDNLDK